MQEIATAGGGRVLYTAADALAAATAASEAHGQQTQRHYQQPRWATWPWWGALLGALTLEWWLRRRGGTLQPLPL